MCVIFIIAVANYLRNRLLSTDSLLARFLRHCHWTGFFKKHTFDVLIRNNEQFDQNLHHTTFLNAFFIFLFIYFLFFWRNGISKGKVIYRLVSTFVLFIQIYTQIYWCKELLLSGNCFLVYCSQVFANWFFLLCKFFPDIHI